MNPSANNVIARSAEAGPAKGEDGDREEEERGGLYVPYLPHGSASVPGTC